MGKRKPRSRTGAPARVAASPLPPPIAPSKREPRPPHRDRQRAEWFFWGVVAGIFLVGAALRLYRLSERGLWIDEIASLSDARSSVTLNKPHFLSFWLLSLSLRFGDSPFWIRLPSAIFGLAGIPAFAWMLRRWFGPTVGMVGAALIAVNPYHLYFGFEARYYTELILFATLSLAAWPSLLPKPSGWALVLFVAANLAAFGVHPTSTIFFGVQLAVVIVLWMAAWRRGGPKRRRPGVARRVGPGSLAAIGGALILTGAAIWIVGRFAWGALLQSNLAALLTGKPLNLVANVGWNARFIFFPYAFGTVYSNNPMPWLPALMAALVLIGWSGAWARGPLFASLALLIWLATLFAVWCFTGTTMAFGSKYVAYVFPLYLGLAAYGVQFLAALFARACAVGPTRRGHGLIVAGAAAAVAAAHLPIDWLCCRGELVGFKKALEMIAASTEGPQKVYTSSHGIYVMGYYRPRLGLQRIETIDLREMGRDRSVGVAEATLKRDLARSERPWMVTHREISHALSQRIVESLGDYFEIAAEIPTIAGSARDVTVRRARPSETFAAAGKSVQWRPAALPFEKTAWLLDSGLWRIGARGPEAGRVGLAAGDAFPSPASESAQEREWRVELGEGARNFRFFRDPPGPAEDLTLNLGLAGRGLPGVPIYAFDSMTPNHDGWDYGFVQGRRALTLLRNSTLHYAIETARVGTYRLDVTAVNDAPRTLIEAALDERPFGVMAWLKADDRYETRTLDFASSAGRHMLDLSFVSDVYGSPDGTPQNSDAILSGFEILPIERPEKGPAAQDFLAQAPMAAFPPRFREDFARLAGPNGSGAAWSLMGDAIRMQSSGIPPGELRLQVPPQAQGCNCVCAPFPAKPGSWLYGSFDLRTVNLRNHSANLAALWYSGASSQPRLQYLFATGVNRTTDWARMPYLIQVPGGVSKVALGLSVYQNGDRPATEPGEVWARNPWTGERKSGP